MPCTIEVFGVPPIVCVSYVGTVSPDGLHEVFLRALAAGEEHKTRSFLADVSQLNGGHSIIDLMDIVMRLESAGIDRRIREAIVVQENALIGPNAGFYETACRNRGFNCRVFTSRADAVAWLQSGADPLP